MTRTEKMWTNNNMAEAYILCKYSTQDDEEINLVKVSHENFKSIKEAQQHAAELKSNGDNSRFVVLVELVFINDSRVPTKVLS